MSSMGMHWKEMWVENLLSLTSEMREKVQNLVRAQPDIAFFLLMKLLDMLISKRVLTVEEFEGIIFDGLREWTGGSE